MNFSPEQELAIRANGSNILVSAGAGSGKTAVLTERIYRLVKSGADISRFLVLTFTNAAAAEMKSRVRDKLLGDPNCAHMAAQIESAHIETFDAFSLFLVKKYAYELNVSQNIKVIDQTVLNIKKRKLIDEIFNEYYESGDATFLEMAKSFSVKDDNNLLDYTFRIAHFCELQNDKYNFLDTFSSVYFKKENVITWIKEKFAKYQKDIAFIKDLASSLEDINDANAICEAMDGLLSAKNYDDLYRMMMTFKFPTKPKTPTTDKEYRDEIKAIFEKIFPKDSDFGTSTDIINSYFLNQKYIEKLLEIVIELEHRLDTFKKEHNAYSFDDIARLALCALKSEGVSEEMKEFFNNILVDEYQDTSDIQEQVISLIGNNNIYMVGDVKQSIYRFRNANCYLFQDKFEKYEKYVDGKEDYAYGGKVELNTSYRSRKEVVDTVNEMFSILMQPQYNVIDYANGHHFGFGFTGYNSMIDEKEDYNLKVYNYSLSDDDDVATRECQIIIDDIIDKINNGYMVYDKDKEVFRKCTFKDFAVLIDRSKFFEDFRRMFAEKGLPIRVFSDEPVRDSSLAYVVKNLMKLFKCQRNGDYGNEYRHAYMSVARSFLLRENDQDIFQAVQKGEYENTTIYTFIKEVLKDHRYHSLYTIMNALFERFDLYNKIITIGHFSGNTHKAEIFLSLAKSMDELGYTVDDLTNYFDDLNNYDLDVSFVDSDVSDDSVTLMTIHKSKGLEFPIVYFPGLSQAFNRSDTKSSYLTSNKFGLIMPFTGGYPYSSLFNSMIKQEEGQEDFEEKLRLFYVALTRVRERAIFILGTKENQKPILNLPTIMTFADMIRFVGFDKKYGVDYVIKGQPLKKEDKPKSEEEKKKEERKITFSTISFKADKITHHRASKETHETVDQNLLDLGNELHYLLEILNYTTKDLSFIKDDKLKRYVNNVLKTGLFDGVSGDNILHEYEFYDSVNHVNGIIDCLVLRENYVDIIDFKLKNIEDEHYVSQLHTYRDYVKTITDKEIRMYLISSMTGEVKEIE